LSLYVQKHFFWAQHNFGGHTNIWGALPPNIPVATGRYPTQKLACKAWHRNAFKRILRLTQVLDLYFCKNLSQRQKNVQ